MANLTTEQATELVDNGNCTCYETDGVYTFHKFSGNLSCCYYEVSTPTQVDLELDESSTEAECKTALIAYFETQEYRGEAPVNTHQTIW